MEVIKLKRKIYLLVTLSMMVLIAIGWSVFAQETSNPGPIIHTIQMDDYEVSVIDGEKLPSYVPSPQGQAFLGWFTENNILYDFDLQVKNSFKLYSKWTLDMNPVFEQTVITTTNGNTASATVTGEYLDDRVVIDINVIDAIISTQAVDLGLRDNVEIIFQAKQTDKHSPNYSLNFLASPDGNHWIRRASAPSSWSANNHASTLATRGNNYDYTVTLTDTGYHVSAYFTYALLHTTYDEVVDNLRLIASLRNTNGGSSAWNHYRDYAALWSQPVTYPILLQDGSFTLRPYQVTSLTEAFNDSIDFVGELPLFENLAILAPTGNSQVLKVTESQDLFSDRFYHFNYSRIPEELRGLSFIYDSIEGTNAVVTEAGYVVLAVPSTDYGTLRFNVLLQGFKKIASDDFTIGSTAPGGGVIEELTDYYVKWAEVDEVISFTKWAIPFFRTLDDSEYFVQEWITYQAPLITDFTNYGEISRQWQGVTGMEVTTNGRIFAGWVTGGNGEPRADNYLVIVYSDDQGETWNDLYILDSTPTVRLNDPEFWQQPDGSLAIYYSQGKTGNAFDGQTGVWQITIANPDDDPSEFIVTEQRRLFDGLMRNRPVILSDGTWLATPNLYADDDYTVVFESMDEGQTWTERSRAYIPNARTFDETIIVEKLDGSLWMTVRSTTGQIIQTFSYDKGYTWVASSYTGIQNPSARFQIIRLDSGNLLLIANNHATARLNMTAFLSYDDGATWSHSLLIDAGTTTYPAVAVTPDGIIHLVYDKDRVSSVAKVMYTNFTEAEIIAGGTLASNRLKVVSDIVSQPLSTNGTTLGDSPLFSQTGGFDLVKDFGSEPSAMQRLGNEQQVFFKSFNGVDFYAETDFTAHTTVNFDAYPKFGIIVKNANTSIFFYIDGAAYGSQGILSNARVGYVTANSAGSWNWGTEVTVPADIKYKSGSKTHMAVVRSGADFVFFINGNKVLTAANIAHLTASDAASVGFQTFNTKATFSSYDLSTDDTLINEKSSHVNHVEVLYIGDSFVDRNRWITFGEFTNKSSHVNIGIGGTRINYWQANVASQIQNYNPEYIVVHIGINDINAGVTGANVASQLQTFFQTIHNALPDTQIYFIAISPSVNRWHYWEETQIANQAVIDFADNNDYVHYIDLASQLLNENGVVNPAYYADLLHLDHDGYQLWEAAIKYALPVDLMAS